MLTLAKQIAKAHPFWRGSAHPGVLKRKKAKLPM